MSDSIVETHALEVHHVHVLVKNLFESYTYVELDVYSNVHIFFPSTTKSNLLPGVPDIFINPFLELDFKFCIEISIEKSD